MNSIIEPIQEVLAHFQNKDGDVIDYTLPSGDLAAAVLVPKTHELKSLKPFVDELRGRPERKEGSPTLETLDSFLAHAKSYRDASSVIFVGRNEVQAIYDYHHPSPDPDGARFGRFGARYVWPLTDEWTRWRALGDKALSQAEFAEWIEDHLEDVIDPTAAPEHLKSTAQKLGLELASPSRLLALSRGLAVHVSSQITEIRNLATGEGQVSFLETHSGAAGEALRVPGAFGVAIPIFQGGPAYALLVRLRYKPVNKQLTWRLLLHGDERALEHARDSAIETLKKELAPNLVLIGKA